MPVQLIGVIFLLAAPLFLWSGIRDWTRRRQSKADWPRVLGMVVSDSVQHVGGTTAEVEFTTLEGQVVRASVDSAVDVGFDATGRRVPVWYNPANPRQVVASVRRGDDSLLPSLVIGVVMIGAGLFVLLVF